MTASGVLRLAWLLARFRLRHAWNGVRARPTGAGGLLVLVGLASSAAYTGMLATALDTIGRRAGQTVAHDALALMLTVFVAGSFLSKAAGTEALRAGSPENEFLLARPVSLTGLVVARSLTALVLDPFGTLFLLPVLVAAALVWRLPLAAVAIAVATSLVAQLGVSAVAQAVQLATVRWVPRRRRALVWTLLRLASMLAMAGVWVTGIGVLRAPARAIAFLDGARGAWWLWPGRWLAHPLVACAPARPAGGGGGNVGTESLVAWAGLLLVALAAVAFLAVVARIAGRRGWEEAGAPWAESRARVEARRPLTLVRREWRQLARDRPRLFSLLALPLIWVGLQVFGSLGWDATSASPERMVAMVYSIVAYVAALGVLPHMQAERRAFWILRSLPVTPTRILAAKARAWDAVLCVAAGALFAALFLAAGRPPDARVAWLGIELVAAIALVVALAVGWGARAADLSDDQRPALGPGTVYLFMLLAGLFNVVLTAPFGPAVARAWLLYIALAVAMWRDGAERLAGCLDAEAMSNTRRQLPLSDAALLIVLWVMLPAALGRAGATGALGQPAAVAAAGVALRLVLGVVAAVWLRRSARSARSAPSQSSSPAARAAGAVSALLLALGAAWLLDFPRPGDAVGVGHGLSGAPLGFLALAGVAEELVWRGAAQGALERCFQGARGRLLAMTVTALLATLTLVDDRNPAEIVRLGCIAALAGIIRFRTRGVAPAVLFRVSLLALLDWV